VIFITLLLNISFTYFESNVCNVKLLKFFRLCPFKLKQEYSDWHFNYHINV
jgi:hypothetical protein